MVAEPEPHAEGRPAAVDALGDSPFNYDDYSAGRFVHYYQTVERVLRYRPSTVLEVGPGDHTVTDFLRRKGIDVRTLDSDPALHPDYLGDVRDPLPGSPRFDLVLACEVLEHLPYAEAEKALPTLAGAVRPGGQLVISLPYGTVRLFPARPDYGRLVSCEGRLHLGIPLRYLGRVVPRYRFVAPPPDRVEEHHWDLGHASTTRRDFQALLRRHFAIVEEKAYRGTNCVFYVLRPLTAGASDRPH